MTVLLSLNRAFLFNVPTMRHSGRDSFGKGSAVSAGKSGEVVHQHSTRRLHSPTNEEMANP